MPAEWIPAQPEDGASERDWLLLGLLVLLVVPLRVWLIYNTEVTARDSIGYIRYALAFEQKPWQKVWREQDQHPGYPLALWAVSVPVRAWAGHTDAAVMQLSAQLVSALASLLLLYPMYHLGRLLLGRPAGFWGSLLFQCWPISGRHLSDGISETLFLLLVASALLQAVRAVEGHRVWRFALCGLFCGLAYLTRPEGALLLPIVGIVLLCQQRSPAWRCSWRRCFAGGATMALVALSVGSVYVQATGRITNKLSALEMIDKARHFFTEPGPGAPAPRLAALGPASLIAAHFPPVVDLSERISRSSVALFEELNQGFHYIGIWVAIFGLAWTFNVLRRRPGFWVLFLYGLIHALILLALAMVVFYVSDRHTMVLLLLGSYLVAVGLLVSPACLPWVRPEGDEKISLLRSAMAWTLIVSLGVLGCCLAKTTQRLHANRAPNRQAGLWLASKLSRGDVIVDDHNWSHFYSGLLFKEGKEELPPPGSIPWCYEVQTRTKEQPLDAAKGEIVWPDHGDPRQARVVVYKRKRDGKTHPWPGMAP
jgi:hypothetical protein